jgi:hypothetical protein
VTKYLNEICNTIIYMTATRQVAIILAFVALREIQFEEMATVGERGLRIHILRIFSF